MSGDCMRFPNTVEEFMNQYKVVDKEGIYMSKGAELVPLFRMSQWFEHEKEQLSQKGATFDPISRQTTVELVMKYCPDDDSTVQCDGDIRGLLDELENLPSAQKKGHWILVHPLQEDDTGAYMCSECKVGNWEIDPGRYFFCPYCGADMRKEEKDD